MFNPSSQFFIDMWFFTLQTRSVTGMNFVLRCCEGFHNYT